MCILFMLKLSSLVMGFSFVEIVGYSVNFVLLFFLNFGRGYIYICIFLVLLEIYCDYGCLYKVVLWINNFCIGKGFGDEGFVYLVEGLVFN